MGDWIGDNVLLPIIDGFAKVVLASLNALWDLLASTVFENPDVTTLPQVAAFADTSLQMVNACYVVAWLWVAVLVLGRDTIQSRFGVGELVPRLIIGLIAANFALPVCSGAIATANAVTAALTGQDVSSPESMRLLRSMTIESVGTQQQRSPEAVLLLLLALLITVLVGLMLVQWVTRVGLLIVVVGVAPIALALHGTPQTEGVARLWWRTLGATLATVTMQAVTLHTTLTIFLSPGANFPVLGLPGQSSGVLNLLIILCMFWAIVKIPGLMRKYVTQAKPNMVGTVLRVVLVQQLTQRLRLGIGRRGRAASVGTSRGGGLRRTTRQSVS
ncbi:hypothetical protein AB0K00_50275 [Dactylosporangium sp. NPDC049525]|uniref:hypothetical protein n=1 Tax=Dactylosporangium sp. NPDC049525 TaxID=3154730 RepID=UPI00341FF49D